MAVLLAAGTRRSIAGTWSLASTTFGGTASGTMAGSGYGTNTLNSQALDNSGLAYTIPATATSLDISSFLAYCAPAGSTQAGTSNSSITFTFVWTPAAGMNLVTDPPPANLRVAVNLRHQQGYNLRFTSAYSVLANSSLSGDGITFPPLGVSLGNANGNQFADTGTADTKIIHQVTTTGSQAVISVPVSAQVALSYNGPFYGNEFDVDANITPTAALVDVVLTSPDATVFPILDTVADDRNRFTYDFTSGVLMNPAWGATFVGILANSAATSFTSFSVGSDNGTPGTKTVVAGNTVSQQFTYTGLPLHNSDFGNKQVTMIVGSPFNTTQTAAVQVFFGKAATNHPLPDLPIAPFMFTSRPQVTPNWYYYWSQTSANDGSVHYFAGNGPGVTDTGLTYYDTAGNTGFAVPKNAWTTVIYDRAGYSTAAGTWNNAEGIDLFANIVRHEAQHLADMNLYWNKGPRIANLDKDIDNDLKSSTYNQVIGDSIPDSLEMNLEPGHAYNPLLRATFSDTFHYGVDPLPDEEDYCLCHQAYWSNGSADKLDWASPGHQLH